MSVTLNIHFTGLCLFVPEPVGINPDLGRMHVLLPMFHAGHHTSEHRHLSLLRVNTAHLRPRTGAGDLADATDGYFKLEDHVLDFSGTAAELKLCSAVVDLRPVTGVAVDRGHLGSNDDDNQHIASRITLGAGRSTGVAAGACWDWGTEPRRIAHRVRWTITGLTAPLSLSLTGLRKKSPKSLPPLHPLTNSAGEEVINLSVFHTPAAELPLDDTVPPDPHPGHLPVHFGAYYELFGSPVPVRLPRYRGKGETCPPLTDEGGLCTEAADKGGSPFNCMVALATP